MKSSSAPKAAQHETRRVLADALDAATAGQLGRSQGLSDPLGEPETPAGGGPMIVGHEDPVLLGPGIATYGLDGAEDDEAEALADRIASQGEAARDSTVAGVTVPVDYRPPATTVQQGVHGPSGEWIDLTDRLREVDERTRIDGMEVVATIATSVIPRERVRDAYYVTLADKAQAKVLALIWHALRASASAAAVRWTKRTNQALGLLVARGTLVDGSAHLVLLDCEWAANMKRAPTGALAPMRADVTDEEVDAAVALVESFHAAPSEFDRLRDERLGKRADLLTLAREGKLAEYAPPPEPVADPGGAVDLVAQLTAAAQR